MHMSDEQLAEFAASLTVEQARTVIKGLGIIGMEEVAQLIGISYHRIKVLRGENKPRTPDRLPEDLPLPSGVAYLRKEILEWGRQTGRLDGYDKPVKLRTTGRPRKRDVEGKFLALQTRTTSP